MLAAMLLAISYASAAVFVAAIVGRIVRIIRLPLHLRWELYPVAHEKGRAGYGGSYLEQSDWWTKPRMRSLAGELKVMVPEILLMAGVWKHNRKHWLRSFPFHFGLYLLAGLVVLLLAGGLGTAAGLRVSAEGGLLAQALYHLTCVVGYAGLGLGLSGAAALLATRTLSPDYREYTKKVDYFNLVFFVMTFLVALVSHASADPDFAGLRAYCARLVTFDFSSPDAGHGFYEAVAPGQALEIVLASLLVAYIPMTHMSHFFTKWFMYHDIRWNDEPNRPGGPIEKKVAEALQYPVSWSAPHIQGDGKKTWADVAGSGPEPKEKK